MIDNAMIQTIYDVQKHNTILNWRAWYPRRKTEASIKTNFKKRESIFTNRIK